MKNLPYWFIGLATLFALGGMAFGIYMSVVEDHTLSGAHAHNNLIGWVTLALYGFYYKAVPAAARTRLALAHLWISVAGAATFPFGIGMTIMGQSSALVSVGAILVVLSMLIFVYTVWSNRAGLATD